MEYNGKRYGWGDWNSVDFSTLVGKTFTIRWYGTSNGYYGEGVDLIQLKIKADECIG